MARKYSLATFAALLKKKQVVKDKILILGAGEPIGEAVLGAVVREYSECFDIVAVVAKGPQKLLQRHPNIRAAIGDIENPAFLKNVAQTAKIVINTHASSNVSAATAAAHLVHVLSHNACPHTFYIHTSSTAILHASPRDPPLATTPRDESVAVAAVTTTTTTRAAVTKVRATAKKDARVRTVWNDLVDVDEICALPVGHGHAGVDAAVREAVKATEMRKGKGKWKEKINDRRVRLAIVAPGVVFFASTPGPSVAAALGDEKSVGFVHVDDLVQLYLRLLEKTMRPDSADKMDDEKRPLANCEWAWEECWGLHAFYFAVTEHVRGGELKRSLGQRNRAVDRGEDLEDGGMDEEERNDEVVVERRCCSERARWILGWVPQNALGP